MKVRTDYDKNSGITAGKIYDAVVLQSRESGNREKGYLFEITNDRGTKISCLEFGCHHLNKNNWEIVEDES